MEEGGKQETYPNYTGCANSPANTLLGGKPQPCYFPRFIWLAPNKDREHRVNILRRCAVASPVSSLESSPELVEDMLHEIYDFEHRWKAIPLGSKTYLIEFPSGRSLDKASSGQVLFGSKGALLIRRWEENIGACGSLQKFWIRLRGLPRECWVWDDVKGVLARFCGLEQIDCGDPVTDRRDYLRALVICSGPQSLPFVVRVGINTKLHDVYINAEIGQRMNPLATHHGSSSAGNVTSGKPEFTSEFTTSSGYNFREMRLKRGYIVGTDSGQPGGLSQSMLYTSPYMPNAPDYYTNKIGPSRFSMEGYSKDEMNSTGSIIGCHKRSNMECQGVERAAQTGLTRQPKRRSLELFPEDFWSTRDDDQAGETGSKGKDIAK